MNTEGWGDTIDWMSLEYVQIRAERWVGASLDVWGVYSG